MQNDKEQKIGTLDDLVVTNDHALFGVLQVEVFSVSAAICRRPVRQSGHQRRRAEDCMAGASKEELSKLPSTRRSNSRSRLLDRRYGPTSSQCRTRRRSKHGWSTTAVETFCAADCERCGLCHHRWLRCPLSTFKRAARWHQGSERALCQDSFRSSRPRRSTI